MSRNPAFPAVSDMEDGVRNVRRWGHVLRSLGSGLDKQIEADQCWIIGRAIIELGDEIEARWEEAFRAAGGQQ
jgi:hypothetical protein